MRGAGPTLHSESVQTRTTVHVGRERARHPSARRSTRRRLLGCLRPRGGKRLGTDHVTARTDRTNSARQRRTLAEE